MLVLILKMLFFISAGVLWQKLNPSRLPADLVRKSISTAVLFVLLPCLVLIVIWKATLSIDSIRISISAATAVLSCALFAWIIARSMHLSRPITGTLILVAAFPNATYMGLPVLTSLFGEQAQGIALQFDLFACLPLLLTLGIGMAKHYGSPYACLQESGPDLSNTNKTQHDKAFSLFRLPPIWAAALAVGLNLSATPIPHILDVILSLVGGLVIPLMLFAIGLSLKWRDINRGALKLLAPFVVLQIVMMPLLVWPLGFILGLTGKTLAATVIEGAMPVMLLGIVITDRFNLDRSLYASAVTITTIGSLILIPGWYYLLMHI